MVAERNVRLEAFKRAIEKSQVKRRQDLQERRSLSRELRENLGQPSLSEEQRSAAMRSISEQQDQYLRESRRQMRVSDFIPVKVIGAGAFGIVRVCQKRGTGEVFALKQMSKAEMVRKNQVHHVCAEKDALSEARGDWVIGLHYTFQDDASLYMVMDYLPGGDLMTYLQRKDRFTEPETRFYIAEIVQAVDYIHTSLGYIHRDLKPDNIVLDAVGHIRLVDFGLCTRDVTNEQTSLAGPTLLEARGAASKTARNPPRALMRSLVGTPDYTAPEVYRKAPCGKECDWWSVGVIAFEMLFGRPPFADERHDPKVTAARVVRWQQYFYMPKDPSIGDPARDLIRGLICEPMDRLTADGIRAHDFFEGLDFEKLREMEPPIKPAVRGPLDTANFDDFSEEQVPSLVHRKHEEAKDPNRFAFHDYGFRRDLDAKKPSVAAALNSAREDPPPEPASASPHSRRVRLADLLVSLAILVCAPKLKAAGLCP